MERLKFYDWFSTKLFQKDLICKNNLKCLEKLSVVIPTYGRQDFILRQVLYWNDSLATIIVLDGSPVPLDVGLQDIISKLSNIKYFHLPIEFSERLKFAKTHIHTPYVISLADDEFHLKSGLCLAINKLEKDQSLSGCIGQSLELYYSKEKHLITYGEGYPHQGYSVKHADARDRMVFAMGNYNAATCYSVLRSDVWSRSWGSYIKSSCPYSSEIQQGLTTYIAGNFTSIDEIYWLRSNENNPVSLGKSFNRSIRFHDWWIQDQYKHEKEEFIAYLANEIVQSSSVNMDFAQKMVHDAVNSYLKFALSSKKAKAEQVSSFQKIKIQLVKMLKHLFAKKFYMTLRNSYNKLSRREDVGGLGPLQKILDSDKFPKMLPELVEEIKEIESLILDFYYYKK